MNRLEPIYGTANIQYYISIDLQKCVFATRIIFKKIRTYTNECVVVIYLFTLVTTEQQMMCIFAS